MSSDGKAHAFGADDEEVSHISFLSHNPVLGHLVANFTAYALCISTNMVYLPTNSCFESLQSFMWVKDY